MTIVFGRDLLIDTESAVASAGAQDIVNLASDIM